MALLDKPLCIEIDDGKVYFKSPGKNAWAEIQELSKLELAEQMTAVVARIIKIENFFLSSGEEVTLESLKDIDLPVPFFLELIRKWGAAMNGSVKAEAETKN